jgi:hypothetical protein
MSEAELNLRAAQIRTAFTGYSLPNSSTPCQNGDLGSGALACASYSGFRGWEARTHVQNLTLNTSQGGPGTVESGSAFADLNFNQFTYQVYSTAVGQGAGTAGDIQAKTVMEFQSRLVPIVQFAAYCAGDMEVSPGPNMTLNGRVHTNGNFYTAPNSTVNINSGAATALTVSGRVNANSQDMSGTCSTGATFVNSRRVGPCHSPSGPLSAVEKTGLAPAARSGVAPMNTPPLSSLGWDPTADLWRLADLRHISSGSSGSTTLEARRLDNSLNLLATMALNLCNASSRPPSRRASRVWLKSSRHRRRRGWSRLTLESFLW